jgi:hypothetical protein
MTTAYRVTLALAKKHFDAERCQHFTDTVEHLEHYAECLRTNTPSHRVSKHLLSDLEANMAACRFALEMEARNYEAMTQDLVVLEMGKTREV